MNSKTLETFNMWYSKHYGGIPEKSSEPYDQNGKYSEYQDYLHCREGFLAGYEIALDTFLETGKELKKVS
jgi:hypothetical protein